TTGDDYVYDANGNMTVDKNKNISSIVYNHLNLPTKIVFPTGNIVYIYNASGQKVQKVVTSTTPASVVTTDYLGGYQYSNTSLQFFPTAEGYVKNTPVSGTNSYSYVFNYTDHLGNTRLSYTKDALTGSLKILEESNYYPFGLKHNGYNPISPIPENRRLFNGKELQEELGLNTYDFGFRQYMPDIGRMPNIDMLAELAYDITPNRYCFNNPLIFIDPSGLWETTTGGYTTNKAEDIKRFMSYLGVENNALNNNPSKEQMGSFIEGEISAGGHGKLSDGSTLADELTIVGTKRKGEDFKNGYADKSFQNFYHGVQKSLTPNSLDPRTVSHNIFWLTYPGPWNPQTYAERDDYSYIPTRPEEFPAITHDLAYNDLKIRGAEGLFTAKSAIPADYKFVTQELAIALSPAYSMRTRVTAGTLGLGLGFFASFKVQYFTVTDAFKETYKSIKK
uniref:RHS repeat domain-containing protein n=1 Tax=Flavobacterium sp. TaxID=239 RepID=UPI0025CE42FB